MQAFHVEFAPAQVQPLRIADAIPVNTLPHPHISVGDPGIPGKAMRIPLTARLRATISDASPVIRRAHAYRDPKSRQIVLGVEQSAATDDPRALVLFAASSTFPDAVSVTLWAEATLLAKGDVRNGQQLLLIWPDGGTVSVADSVRGERYAVRRDGEQFERVVLPDAA